MHFSLCSPPSAVYRSRRSCINQVLLIDRHLIECNVYRGRRCAHKTTCLFIIIRSIQKLLFNLLEIYVTLTCDGRRDKGRVEVVVLYLHAQHATFLINFAEIVELSLVYLIIQGNAHVSLFKSLCLFIPHVFNELVVFILHGTGIPWSFILWFLFLYYRFYLLRNFFFYCHFFYIGLWVTIIENDW